MQRCTFGSAIVDTNLDENVVHGLFGVFDENIEITILVEDARIQQLDTQIATVPSLIDSNQLGIGKGRMRILARGTSYKSASGYCRDRSSIPLRPHRDCPLRLSSRRGVP